MATIDFQFRDYVAEQSFGEGAGGVFFRALSPSENGGRGRRDLVYRAHKTFAQDVNVVETLRDCLEKYDGVTHSGLLSPISASITADELLVVSEWSPGVTLAAFNQLLAESDRKWPLPHAIHLASELVKTLSYLQTAPHPLLGTPLGIVHGQVRPENIFITFGGQVKLIGLGAAAVERYALMCRGGFFASQANYSSPELAAARETDGRSDLFSVGVVLWELLTGRALFPAASPEESARVLSEKSPPPASQARAEVPKELNDVLAKLLDRDLHLRYELGEKATQDMLAVLKFKYPEFNAGEFTAFCKESLAAVLAGYQRSTAPSRTTEETKITEAAPASPAPSPGLAPVQPIDLKVKPVELAPITVVPERISYSVPKPAPARILAPNEINPLLGLFSYGGVKAGLAACCIILAALPFALPRFSRQSKSQREIARVRALKAREKYATLRFLTSETDYQVSVNGKPVDVVDGRANVIANQEIAVVVAKDGYEDIQLDTELVPDEEFSVPISFKKLASTD